VTGKKDDPWSGRDRPSPPPENPVKPAPLPRPVNELRAEMVAAVGKLPADTRMVIALGVAEMRADENLSVMAAAAAKLPELELIVGAAEVCPIDIEDLDWIVIGFAKPDMEHANDAVMRGRWTDEELQTCIGALGGAKPVVDAATGMIHVDGVDADYWFGTDGATVAISIREKANAAHVEAMLARTEGPGGVVGALIPTLDRDATVWLVVDADAKDTLDGYIDGIPAGGDVALWARIDNGLRGEVVGRMQTEADAKKAETKMRTDIDEMIAEGASLMGTFEVARDAADVRLTLWLTPFTLTLATQEILKGMEE
jgi:hypothetical protein